MFIVMNYLGHHNKKCLHQCSSNFYISIIQNLQIYCGKNAILVDRPKSICNDYCICNYIGKLVDWRKTDSKLQVWKD